MGERRAGCGRIVGRPRADEGRAIGDQREIRRGERGDTQRLGRSVEPHGTVDRGIP